jgi:methylated-DNA-[protein]-cysteine S-methyltransferase
MAQTARPVAWVVIASEFGPIHVAVDLETVVGLELRSTDTTFIEGLRRRLGPMVAMRWGDRDGLDDGGGGAVDAASLRKLDRRIVQADRSITAYLSGDRSALDLPVSLHGLSGWDVRVLQEVRRIPFGAVTSYGRVARRIGARGAARAVGGAVGRNPVGLIIPCHRVIAGDGSLGGYGGGWWGGRAEALELKRALLAHERVSIPARDLLGSDDDVAASRTLPAMDDASPPS